MNMSENIDKIAPAIVEVQDSMVAIKDADNPFFKSKYAPLDEILKSIRPALKKNGITVIQSMETQDKTLNCTTRIMHKSGQWIDSTLSLSADKATPQGFGSAATYVRRYGICAALSISTPNEDDDGNKAETSAEKAKAKAAEKKKKDIYAAKLNDHKMNWREGLLTLELEALVFAFGADGYVTEKEGKEAALDDLLSQVDQLTKMKNIKELAKKKHAEITSAAK